MVANSYPEVRLRDSLDPYSIRTKLQPDSRGSNNIEKDIAELSNKMHNSMAAGRFEIFVHIAYELYRSGTERE